MTTSRIGRKPVTIPSGVTVTIKDQRISAKGPKGHLEMDLHEYVLVVMEKDQILIHPNTQCEKNIRGAEKRLYRSIPGTIRAKIFNIIKGVTEGFEEKLSMVGVGYRAQSKGKALALSLGFSHPTEYGLPEGVTAETPTQTEITLKSTSKENVGQAAAKIRSIRPPEPYKGKGVRYADEVIELKETKKK